MEAGFNEIAAYSDQPTARTDMQGICVGRMITRLDWPRSKPFKSHVSKCDCHSRTFYPGFFNSETVVETLKHCINDPPYFFTCRAVQSDLRKFASRAISDPSRRSQNQATTAIELCKIAQTGVTERCQTAGRARLRDRCQALRRPSYPGTSYQGNLLRKIHNVEVISLGQLWVNRLCNA